MPDALTLRLQQESVLMKGILPVVMLCATAWAQQVPHISELDPLMDCVTFHVSFDGGKFAPDVAAGSGDGKLSG
jgi:hypothetical protein